VAPQPVGFTPNDSCLRQKLRFALVVRASVCHEPIIFRVFSKSHREHPNFIRLVILPSLCAVASHTSSIVMLVTNDLVVSELTILWVRNLPCSTFLRLFPIPPEIEKCASPARVSFSLLSTPLLLLLPFSFSQPLPRKYTDDSPLCVFYTFTFLASLVSLAVPFRLCLDVLQQRTAATYQNISNPIAWSPKGWIRITQSQAARG
jgi:hypothetical protein